MKILIIAKNVGRIAPGIVAERLIEGLSEIHDLDVLSADYDPSFKLTKVKKVILFKSWKLNSRISKFFISFFSVDPLDIYVAKKAIYSCEDNYDLIFSVISSDHYVSLIIGNKLSKKFKIKHYAHFLDAIPAPGGWLKRDYFYRGVERFIANTLVKVDGVFATNQEMLNYQLSTFEAKKNIKKEVIYNPGPGEIKCYKQKEANKNTFIFIGGLYGPRKPLYILEAFKILLKNYPDSTLEFVGSNIKESNFSIFSSDEIKKIKVYPYQRNLIDYYERATALIDIDADFPNDVFISSKIINYISVNRIIISQTGENSPSRKMFKGIPSIIQTGHNANEIANAMRTAIQKKDQIDFSDRKEVVSLFDIKVNIERLNKAFSYIEGE